MTIDDTLTQCAMLQEEEWQVLEVRRGRNATYPKH